MRGTTGWRGRTWRRLCAGGALVTVMAGGGILVGVEPAAPVSYNHPVVPAHVMHRLPSPQHVHLNEVHTDARQSIPGPLGPTWRYVSGPPSIPPAPPPAHSPVAARPTLPTPPPPPVVSGPPGLPSLGGATAYGCDAALAYLAAYAAPGFVEECPGNAQGHQATTMCLSVTVMCDVGRFIMIADPCAAAYMNEASNSWVLLGLSRAPIDPYGKCR